MRIGVAGIPGASSTERMAESLRREGGDVLAFSCLDMLHDLVSGRVELHGLDLSSFDAIVVKKLDDQSSPWGRLRLHALRALEQGGVRIFSPVDAIDVAMDRYRMTMVLAAAGLPVPATLAAESEEGLRAAIDRVGDAVIKPVYTSKGRGMFRLSAADSVHPAARQMDAAAQRHLVQRFVRAPGRDIGATVIGGKFVGAFYRVADEGEWMTTTARGGTYKPCVLPDAGVALAEQAARLFGLDYTVVDLVEEDQGLLLYEVSAFGGFRGLAEATGIDPSVEYARYIVREIAAR